MFCQTPVPWSPFDRSLGQAMSYKFQKLESHTRTFKSVVKNTVFRDQNFRHKWELQNPNDLSQIFDFRCLQIIRRGEFDIKMFSGLEKCKIFHPVENLSSNESSMNPCWSLDSLTCSPVIVFVVFWMFEHNSAPRPSFDTRLEQIPSSDSSRLS